ncbi:MAG TPA: phosphotransferase [Ktedonobacterales bacterium]|nr:phosphotransferase [Ktedonobacterales bacterium]
MEFVCALEAAGLAIAAPVPSRRRCLVETVDSDWGTYHAVVFPALGQCAGPPARPSWRDHLASTRRYLPPDSAALRAEYEHLANWLASLPIDDDTYGTIHGDFERDTLIWRWGMVGVLDFDDSVQMWYAADVAFAVRDLFAGPSRNADTDDPRFQACVEGYQEHRALDDKRLARVPRFLRFARLREYAGIVRTLDLLEARGQADWFDALRDKLSRRAAAYRAMIEARGR